MRIYLSLLFSLLVSFAFAQKINAKIITVDNDTLRVMIKVTSNMIDPSLIYPTSFTKKAKLISEDGKKSTLEASQISQLSFSDPNGKERVFVNNSADKKTLTERMFSGNVLEWYRSYDQSYGFGGENSSDYLYNKFTQKGIGVGYFTGLPKKKLKEFLGDEPEMNNLIEETKSSALRNAVNNVDACMETIIKKYESLKAKNN